MTKVDYIELFWDCPNCQQRHISAVLNPQSNRCPTCLHWRTDEVELYAAPDSQVITDPKLINRKPFWVCKVCAAVNEDEGLAAHLLKCSNCDSYQTSETGEISGDFNADLYAPKTLPVDEPVPFQPDPIPKRSPRPSRPQQRLRFGCASVILGGLGAIFLGQGFTSHQPLSDPNLRQVQVTDLGWTTEVDVQRQIVTTQGGWQDSLPDRHQLNNFTLIKSEQKQRSTIQKTQGFRTKLVNEQYQSGTDQETYSEPEQYQSGTHSETYNDTETFQTTHSETYWDSERYQSGIRTETYNQSERYQSGTQETCKMVSQGNGLGKRTCRNIPAYSTREVQRTRTVPVYSTRQVQRQRQVTRNNTRPVIRTRTVPIYSTRTITRTREVPRYSTRQVVVQEPIVVNQPIYDTWVTYRHQPWVTAQTNRRTGKDDIPRQFPQPRLPSLPRHRISDKREICKVDGHYPVFQGWFKLPLMQSSQWVLPCADYDRINIGDAIELRLQKSPQATTPQPTTLVTILPMHSKIRASQ
jgi:hypothetical protein